VAGNLQLPPDRPRLPLGRRGVHRGQGESRHHGGVDGCRGLAGGLRSHRVGLCRCRRGGGHLGSPRDGLCLAGKPSGGPVRWLDRPWRPGQLAGHPPIGTHLRGADVPVPLQLPGHDRLGPGPLLPVRRRSGGDWRGGMVQNRPFLGNSPGSGRKRAQGDGRAGRDSARAGTVKSSAFRRRGGNADSRASPTSARARLHSRPPPGSCLPSLRARF
jgi:hypothetical protein